MYITRSFWHFNILYISRYDDTLYPNIAQYLGNRKAVVFKITMDVFAKSIEAKDDLRTFVWDFGQEHNQVCTLGIQRKL